MAKGIYLGDPITGVAKEIKKLYIGDPVTGVARNVQKVYIGDPVTGLARLCWTGLFGGMFYHLLYGSGSLYNNMTQGDWTSTTISQQLLKMNEDGVFKKLLDLPKYTGTCPESFNIDKPSEEHLQFCTNEYPTQGHMYFMTSKGVTVRDLYSTYVNRDVRHQQYSNRYMWLFTTYFQDPLNYYTVTVVDRFDNYNRVFNVALASGYANVAQYRSTVIDGYILSYDTSLFYYQPVNTPTAYFTKVVDNVGSIKTIGKYGGYYYAVKYTSLYRSSSLFGPYTEVFNLANKLMSIISNTSNFTLSYFEMFKGTMVLFFGSRDYDGNSKSNVAFSTDLGNTWNLLGSHSYDIYRPVNTKDVFSIMGNNRTWMYTEDGVNWLSKMTNFNSGNLYATPLGYVD